MTNESTAKAAAAHSALENLRLRLLDLTSRNRLISFRHTKRASLRIVDEHPDQLAEMLLADKEMRFQAVPEPSEEELIEAGYLGPADDSDTVVELKPYPDAVAWAQQIGIATSYDVPVASPGRQKPQHADNAMQTLLYPYEMESALRSLMSRAESAIHEMGANILYIALGFLEWFDSPTSTTARTAPLFLIPCRLNKGRLNRTTRMYEYTLQYSGEDIIPNLSLREKLKADFAMALPDLDEETTPESYFQSVTGMLDAGNQPRWRIRRHISIALLNFSKLLMYQDLDPQRWPAAARIEQHPVVSRFLFGSSRDNEEGEQEPELGFGEEHPIDDTEDVHEKYPLIDDADSSQHSALIDAIDGKNLVIEGPPGTGKSQTITNLIAAAVSQGKRVLFVAEKLAALSVVHSRLDRAGLGDFCLELHSHKAQKRKVLDEVAARIAKRGSYRPPHQIAVEIARYEELKETLKRHARKVNSPWGNTGKTIHEILMAATRYRNEIGIIQPRSTETPSTVRHSSVPRTMWMSSHVSMTPSYKTTREPKTSKTTPGAASPTRISSYLTEIVSRPS
jgi:Cdc6-like AAA superfamily ATPase